MNCPAFIVGSMAFLTVCLTQLPTFEFNTGCPNTGLETQSYGTAIGFTSNFTTTYIGVSGDLNYDFAPTGNIYVDFLILDACDGDVIFNTWNFTPCEVGQDLIFASSPMPWTYDYWIELNLPPGNDYILLIGAVGLDNIQEDLEGCVEVTIISDVLGLSVVERKKRTTIELIGFNLIGQRI